MTPTESMLLRAVLESPGDDTPRLAYADWLDENAGSVPCSICTGPGFPRGPVPAGCTKCRGNLEIPDGRRERAEFVRVQCRYPTWFEDATCLEHSDYRPEYLSALNYLKSDCCDSYLSQSLGGKWGPDIGRWVWHRINKNRVRVELHRGFVSTVRTPLAVLVGGECNECYSHQSWGDFTSPNPDCPACSGTGRVGGIGRELFENQPVTRVEVTDWRPALVGTGRGYVWDFPDPGRLGSPVRPEDYPHRLYNPGEYPTLGAASDALSAAVVAYFREQAGLPPL